MRHIRTVGRFGIAIMAAFTTPSVLSAGCTENYMACLREAYEMESPVLREMKNIECGAGWAGCVVNPFND
jgi:hypothetical protein